MFVLYKGDMTQTSVAENKLTCERRTLMPSLRAGSMLSIRGRSEAVRARPAKVVVLCL